MNCGTCTALAPPQPRIRGGMRVTVSRWEQVWLGKELVGTVERVFDTHEAIVRWDNGHKDRRWPVGSLIPVEATTASSPVEGAR